MIFKLLCIDWYHDILKPWDEGAIHPSNHFKTDFLFSLNIRGSLSSTIGPSRYTRNIKLKCSLLYINSALAYNTTQYGSTDNN